MTFSSIFAQFVAFAPQLGKLTARAEQLVVDGGEAYLKPLNTRYPIKPLGTAKIIGVVREFTKRFR